MDTSWLDEIEADEAGTSAAAKSTKPLNVNCLKATPLLSKRQKRKQRYLEKGDTAGSGWFDMAKPELTEQVKADLKVLQLRGALDSKRFYKKGEKTPKYFQMGTIVDAPQYYHSSRLLNKHRKSSFAAEVLADPNVLAERKRRFDKIQNEAAEKASTRGKRKTTNERIKVRKKKK